VSAVAEELIRRVPTLICSRPAGGDALEGEHVYDSAACMSSGGQQLVAYDALQYPAVQCWSTACEPCKVTFELVEADALIAAGICRRLDEFLWQSSSQPAGSTYLA